MNFSNLKEWVTPRGKVTELAIDGVTVWKKGIAIGSLPVGSSVFMNCSGMKKEFLVVHQGLPDATLYDESCNGTWLLEKYGIYSTVWYTYTDDYAESLVNTYLNRDCITFFDDNIQNIIKQVKIPYTKGMGSNASLATGANGLSVKLFCLSTKEINLTMTNCNNEGAVLSYFAGAKNDKRILYDGVGSAQGYFLRSPSTSDKKMYAVNTSGNAVNFSIYGDTRLYIRAALVLPSGALIDENFNVIG